MDLEDERRQECDKMLIAMVIVSAIIALFTLFAVKCDVEDRIHSQTNQSQEED